MNQDRRISYFRTLVFTVIAFVMSLGLLVLWYLRRDVQTFVILVEIGIFTIIGYCIWNIVQYERALQDMRRSSNYTLKMQSCPDYYVKRRDPVTSKDFCSNEYVVVDDKSPTGKKLIMKITPVLPNVLIDGVSRPNPDTPSAPEMHHIDYMKVEKNVRREPDAIDKFYINVFDDIKAPKKLCDTISPYSTEGSKTAMSVLKHVPWTYARSRCNGLFVDYDSDKPNSRSLM